MATVRNEIYNKILSLLDQRSEDGVDIPDSELEDIAKKVIDFTDMHQKESWNLSKNTKQIELVLKPPENRMGGSDNYELVDFEGDTQYYPNEDGVDDVQSYSIQVTQDASDNATITLQEKVAGTWTDLTVITPTGLTEFTTYKGSLTVSDTTNPVRYKIEGTEHFLHKNRALYKFKYKSGSTPTYEPWVQIDLPDDFNSVDMIVEELSNTESNTLYSQSPNYKLESYKDFYYSFDFNGLIRITYHPIPATITSLDDELQIDVTYSQNIIYDVIAKLGFYENPDLVNWSEGRRIENKQDATNDKPLSTEVVADYYG